MKNFILPIERLISEFAKLPSVGRKTATRYAYHIVNMSETDVKKFCEALLDAKTNVRYCSICGNFTDKEVCDDCQRGDQQLVCVVEEPKDILALQKVRDFTGVYHVLHGVLSPLDGKTADDIRIKELLDRVNKYNVREVIMATNPTVEGEATALYISKLLKPLGVKVTRIAQGVSLGSDLEYVDEVTLGRAINDRREI